MKPIHCIALVLVCLLAACSAATQNIPVSSNPDGALVLADGKKVCSTPCNVTLEKTQPHILTLKKEGYRQVDVQISRKYDTASVTRDATRAGMWTSSNGANTQGAVANALMNVSADEQSGDAYVLTPGSVVVRLQPVCAVAQADGQAPIVLSPDQLTPADRARLEGADSADIQTTEPATLGDAVADDPEGTLKEAASGAAIAAPTVGAQKEFKSSHSSESYGSDGSYSKTTTSTSVGVGVHVNPVEAGLGVLNLLEGAG
ncbi:MAG: PEGA domain-containing protein, partial [Pseudodesulfovibrio sp.]